MQLELSEKGQTVLNIKLLRDSDDCVISLMSISVGTFQGQFFFFLLLDRDKKATKWSWQLVDLKS